MTLVVSISLLKNAIGLRKMLKKRWYFVKKRNTFSNIYNWRFDTHEAIFTELLLQILVYVLGFFREVEVHSAETSNGEGCGRRAGICLMKNCPQARPANTDKCFYERGIITFGFPTKEVQEFSLELFFCRSYAKLHKEFFNIDSNISCR